MGLRRLRTCSAKNEKASAIRSSWSVSDSVGRAVLDITFRNFGKSSVPVCNRRQRHRVSQQQLAVASTARGGGGGGGGEGGQPWITTMS
eukprot:COSAG01_NODE_10076_length_2250_cov_3.924861_3_plen_89_part_00